RSGHAEGSARGWNDDAEAEKKTAHQQQPVVARSNPSNDFSIDGIFREPAFKPAAAAHSCGGVVELCAKRVGGESDESDGSNVEVAAAGKECTGDKNGFAFDNDAGKY